jgi:zinc protease
MSRPHLTRATLVAALLALACGQKVPPPTLTSPAEKPDPRYQTLPKPLERRAWAPPAAKKIAMPNGQTLWLMKRETTPLFSLKVILPRGGGVDPVDKAGLTELTADLIDEGAGPMSAVELSEAFDLISADYSAEVNVDATILSLNGLSENLERSLELLSYILTAPRLSESEFESRKLHHLAEVIARRDEPMLLLSEQLKTTLFGSGYAGLPIEGTDKTLKAILLADVRKHASSLLGAEGAHFVLVGPVSEARALRLFGTHFANWSGKSTLEPRAVVETKAVPEVQIVPFPGAAQTGLGVVRRAGPALTPDYFGELVMNERLGGSFTSRINLNLREDKGYTYGASSFFHRYRSVGMFGIMANVHAQATGASLKEIFGELKALCNERPLGPEEREEAVNGLLLGYPLRFENNHSIALQLATLPLYDRPLDFYQTWPTQVGAVTRDEMQTAASRYCNPADYSVVLVGDPDTILPQLEKVGMTGRTLPPLTTTTPEATPPKPGK